MSGSVLIVDDSLTVRMDLLEAFEAGGFQAIPCATAAEARLALASQPVDAVILDVLLPDGDGVELLGELRASTQHSSLVVVLLSTESEVKDRIRGLRRGADDYVGKPYDTGYVVAKVHQLQRMRGTSADDAVTVLVIDDSLTFRMELQGALEGEGYRVITAETGEEGLRLAADVRPGAIVVDCVLPGVDGATVVRRIRLDAALRDVPCLLLTASTDGDAELDVLDAGADAFVRKGEDVGIVLAKLAATLRQSSATTSTVQAGSLHGPKRVLAVDDSPTYLDQVSTCLLAEGYEVILARSGFEALDLLATQTVDCILLDLLMPGLDGRETCRRIKAVPAVRDIPLIMITGMDDAEGMISGLRDGADDYIQKSAELNVLKARVSAQIRRKHFQDENRRIREQLLRKELEAAEARAAQELAETRAALVEELEWKNRELEAFTYSVSHDLRNPLHVIDAFSLILLEDYIHVLDETGHQHLRRIHDSAQRMGELIRGLLRLSQVSRAEISRDRIDLTVIANQVIDDLRGEHPDPVTACVIEEGMVIEADANLVLVLMENLLGNAWKYTRRTQKPLIEVGTQHIDDELVTFVRDNGAGFSVHHSETLFQPYTRLHSESEFPGMGIGLATVHRVVDRHGGRIWANGEVGSGATFYFTLR
jgi:two-component system, NtrC family, sensor kinase